jgi:hypothetical protein
VATDRESNILLAAALAGPGSFVFPGNVGNVEISSNAGLTFIGKLSQEGVFIWGKTPELAYPGGAGIGNAIAVDLCAGELFAAGVLESSAVFDGLGDAGAIKMTPPLTDKVRTAFLARMVP